MRLRSHTVGAVSFWHEGVRHNRPGWWRIVSGELFSFVERWAGAAVSMGMEVEEKLGGDMWRHVGFRYIIMWRRGFLREK